jgi:hypothetical protein
MFLMFNCRQRLHLFRVYETVLCMLNELCATCTEMQKLVMPRVPLRSPILLAAALAP